MLDYLRGENSKLADEVAFLKGQLKLKSVGNTASGVASSPWSAIDGSGSLGSFGTAKVSPMNRPGAMVVGHPETRIEMMRLARE